MILTLAEGIDRGALRSAMAALVPDWLDLEVSATGRGAVAVAGAFRDIGREWLVVGRPLADPWGVPGNRHAAHAADAFDRYGAAAVQMMTGPFAAVHPGSGTVVRAMNGIVPVYVSSGDRWVASTDARVARGISGRSVRPLSAGSAAGPSHPGCEWAAPIGRDDSAKVPWAWIDAAIAERTADLAGGLHRRDAVDPDIRFCPDGCSVFLPRLAEFGRRRGGGLGAYARTRDTVLPALWQATLRRGRWLHAPAFERPVADTLAMLTAGSGAGAVAS